MEQAYEIDAGSGVIGAGLTITGQPTAIAGTT
jgi:hypothetical protein